MKMYNGYCTPRVPNGICDSTRDGVAGGLFTITTNRITQRGTEPERGRHRRVPATRENVVLMPGASIRF